MAGTRPTALLSGLVGRLRRRAADEDRWLREGRERHQAGDLPAAESLYRRALAAAVQSPEPAHLLGVLLAQHGRLDEARALLVRAAGLAPASADVLADLGNAHALAGQDDEAGAAYERARALQPGHPGACRGLAVLHERAGRLRQALACQRELRARHPDDDFAPATLGGLLLALGQPEEAARELEEATHRQPASWSAWADLGVAYYRLRRTDEALDALRKACELGPRQAAVHTRLGGVLYHAGLVDEAGRVLRRATELDPGDAAAWSNLGNVLRERERPGEAEHAYASALAAAPGLADAHANLAELLREQGRQEEAATHLDLLARHGAPDAHADSNRLLALNYRADLAASEVLACHEQWAARWAEPLTRAATPLASPAVLAGRRLRVGYVSPDLRRHSVAWFFEPVLRAHERARVEVWCYADLRRPPDDVSARLRTLSEHWVEVQGLSDEALCARVRDDGIDVLVDLCGHMAGHRLLAFARRCAPVQVTWLGYPNTTGMRAMDYRLTDAIADPPGAADHAHTEELLRLPGGFLCYAPPVPAPHPGSPPAERAGVVTFGSFNNLAKVTGEVVACWARLLRELPGSRLLLKAAPLADGSVQARLRERFAAHGIDGTRLRLHGWVAGTEAHLAFYDEVDVALDTFPYNGTTTTCEALWMGVPVVTVAGERHAARVGASILARVGLDELVAPSLEGYGARALGLARDPARLASLRASLRGRMRASTLLDGPRLAAALESLFERLCAPAPDA